MKYLPLICVICAGLLLLAIARLPIGYYTFLRIAVTIGSIAVIHSEFKNGINLWVILFCIIAIVFNPLNPVYLHSKATWIPIDIVAAIIFTAKSLMTKENK
ncbi:MAG: hypothetical protein LBQ28_03685 [Prevotellaceae bacterium]|jgi:hypothetical protein|nr:hypothetical protein [Prevotellaceae bacterium]